MGRKNAWGLWAGVSLMIVGLFFLIGQLFNLNVMFYFWPFFILVGGALFFVLMFAGGRAMGAMAVPGSVIITVGLILFVQNLFNLWATWSYSWALIIAGAGVGLIIFGAWSELPDLRRAGRVVVGVGLALFFVFGLFFELGAGLLGLRSPAGIFWPAALILVGLYVLFGRAFFNLVGGPVKRSAVNIAPESQAEGASGESSQVVEGSPTVVPASGIRRLEFHTLGDITIIQGDREGLEIEASDLLRERIRSEVQGDRLVIRYEQDWLDWLNPRFWNITPIHFTVYLRDLDMLDSDGLGNLLIPTLTTSRLDLKHSGTGNMTIKKLQAETLVVRQAGLGNIDIAGRINEQEVHLSGAGSYQAGGLESRAAAIHLSGMGSATVAVMDALNVHLSGMGSVDYIGNPKVTQHASSLGSVRQLGGR